MGKYALHWNVVGLLLMISGLMVMATHRPNAFSASVALTSMLPFAVFILASRTQNAFLFVLFVRVVCGFGALGGLLALSVSAGSIDSSREAIGALFGLSLIVILALNALFLPLGKSSGPSGA